MYRNSKALKKKESALSQGPVNRTLLYIFGGMILLGVIMVFDASVYKASELFGDPFYFLRQHIIWLVLGGIAGFTMYTIDYRILSKLSFAFLLIIVIFLIFALILGNDINGAKRWFEIAGLTFQPAEFAKLAMVIYLASILSKEPDRKITSNEMLLQAFKSRLMTFLAILITIVVLVMMEPDMGTTMIIGLTSFLIFFISGEDRIHTIGSILVAGVMGIAGVAAAVVAPYRFERIRTFMHLLTQGKVDNPTGEGYQISQILIGIGSSGFWGKGFGQSRQRFGYLVENTAFTDSIFAILLEELGFASAIMLVILWLVVLWQGFKTSIMIEDKFGKLLVAGITIWLVTQALLNMAANVALIPLTGIPLPFLTYGGSNTIVTLAAVGLLLNVTRYAKTTTK